MKENVEEDDAIEGAKTTFLIERNNSNLEKEKKEKKDEDDENSVEKNLIFEVKSISLFKLICHLSGKLEIFLMIIGTISTTFSGCSYALWGLLLGNSINDLSDVVDIDHLPDDQYQKELDKVEVNINKMVSYFIMLGIFTFVGNFFMLFMWGYSALRQMHKMKKNYFSIILRQEQSWFDENNAFEFSTKVQSQLEKIEFGMGDKFGQILLMFSEILSGFIVGFITSWKLTLVLFTSLPFMISAFAISDHYGEQYSEMSRKINDKAGGIAEELLYNIKTVASFCNFDFELNRYEKLIEEVNEYKQKKSLIEGFSFGLIVLGFFVSFSSCILFSRSLIINKEINYSTGEPYNGGDVAKVFFCVLSAIYSIGNLGPNIQVVKESCISSSDYFTLLNRIPKISSSNSNYIPSKEDFKGKIEFKNIKFMYPNDKEKKLILNGLNLLIEPGKKIALVGESGCGKSTTINLIERFYESNEGEILIDDIDIKKYNLNHLRDLIGYVQQEPVLFNTTIRENIIFGREQKLKRLGKIEKMIEDACEDAYIKEFIENNVDKYNYIVGIKGSKLSGGQKQRIAIARAILLKPKILILDEATSALDNQSEKEVQKALDNICKKNITIIVIAHRLSTIKNSDVIYAMKEGKIIEKGNHKELLELNGYYAGLIKNQLAEDEIKKEEETENNDNEILDIIDDDDNDEVDNNEININNKNNHIDTKNEEVTITNSNSSLNNSSIINNINVKEIKKKGEKEITIERKRIWKLIYDNKCDLYIGAICGFIYGSLSSVVGILLGTTINILSSKKKEKISTGGFLIGLIYIGIGILGGITIFLKIWKLESVGSIISFKIRKKVIKKYLELHMGYYDIDKNSPGALLTKLSIDTSQLDSLILNIVGGTITVIGTFIIMIGLGLIYDWKITLILALFLPLSIFGVVKKEDYMENGREGNKKVQIEAGSILSESVINTKTIFSFNFQQKAIEIYSNILSSETKDFLKNCLMQGFWVGLGLCCFDLSFAAAYKFAIIFMRNRSLTYQNFNCVITNIINSCEGLTDILRNMGDSAKAKLSFKSVFSTLDTKTKISSFEIDNMNKISPSKIKGKIEFKNVYFAYPTKRRQLVLKNVSFVINPGEKIGLVGLSGSGKSSIIQLIERFYDVNKGEILIDDINIKEYNLYELRKKIGLVSQEPVLFKRSIYENILYGKLNSYNDEVFDAATKADLSIFFNDKNFGNKDNPLSGGEKQRVAIARAFLKNPTIVLLDEATSALDKETENEIQKNIFELQKGRTCISVAHRLSTIMDSDVIFVMESGRLVEKGTHNELMQLKGKYYTLYKYS